MQSHWDAARLYCFWFTVQLLANIKNRKLFSPQLLAPPELWNYTQPSVLAIVAVRNVTIIAVPRVMTTLRVAHLYDFVSL